MGLGVFGCDGGVKRGAEHFVAAMGSQQLDETFHRVALEAVTVDFLRHIGHAKVDGGAVAIEGSELRLEVDHVFSLDESANPKGRLNTGCAAHQFGQAPMEMSLDEI